MIETKKELNDNDREIETQLSKLRDYKIVKHNDLIQKSRFQLSMQEQKIILYLISKIKPEDSEFQIYSLSIQDFCKVCGIDYKSGKNYKDIRDTVKTLADKSLWVKLDNGKETLVRWINKAWIDTNSGIIEIRLDDDMQPYLLQLRENFTQYELIYTLAMKSRYSIRIYELLKSYAYKKQKITFDIEELKHQLSAKNYTRFPDFKRYVIEIAMREINDFSDLSVTYDTIKQGKRYAKIKFTIEIKEELDERLETWANIDGVISPKKISLLEKLNRIKLDAEEPC